MKYHGVRLVTIENVYELSKIYHRCNSLNTRSLVTRFSHFEYTGHRNVRMGLVYFYAKTIWLRQVSISLSNAHWFAFSKASFKRVMYFQLKCHTTSLVMRASIELMY